eukprot:tig00000157_g9709.t1
MEDGAGAADGSSGSGTSPVGGMSTGSSNLSRKKTPAPAPVKKMVIKPFKVKPKLPEQFEAETWEKLKGAVAAVHTKQPVSCSLEELYRAVEDLCLHKMAENLYKQLQAECESFAEKKLKELLKYPCNCERLPSVLADERSLLDPRRTQTPDHVVFLAQVESAWQDHCNQMLTIRSIFLYLDRTYVIQTANVRSLWEMGLQLFRKYLTQHKEVEEKTIQGLLALIEKERCGEVVDRPLLKNLLRMLSSLQMYADCFEKVFLEETNAFYRSEGERFKSQTDVPDYLKHVETRLKEENERVNNYLDASTKKPLIQALEKQLLTSHVEHILTAGFDGLMDETRKEDLRRMYTLLKSVMSVEELKKTWHKYIRTTGLKMVEDEQKDKQMVQDLLDFKAKLDGIWDESFDRNDTFMNALKDAFESFINTRQNKPAELIAKFIDGLLRAGNKGQSEEELESAMDKVMTLFRFIQGKDVFEAFYKKDLAKRLLLGKSASTDAEKSMISKLKNECGSTFTNKLEGMFKDIDLSKDIMGTFRQSSRHAELLGDIELHVSVLTTGSWPPYTADKVNLPQELGKVQEVFSQFYLAKHSGRRLHWQNSLGHCVLKAWFPLGKKELSVSLFQAVVLMLFNDTDSIGFQEIKEASGIEDKELRRTLQSLACAKIRVLNKLPKGKDVADEDVFQFNAQFQQKLFRIKINSIQMKETQEESASTNERVFQDRQYQVDAAIVRIMKARKTLAHNQLLTELLPQLKFPVKPADCKKRIESLIEREYLERSKDNPQVYNYLA